MRMTGEIDALHRINKRNYKLRPVESGQCFRTRTAHAFRTLSATPLKRLGTTPNIMYPFGWHYSEIASDVGMQSRAIEVCRCIHSAKYDKARRA